MFSLRPRCCRPLQHRLPPRYLSSSAPALAAAPGQRRQSENDDKEEEEEDAEAASSGKTYQGFLKQYSHLRTAKPRAYVKPDLFETPFPMNMSFKPPAPISDATRSRMYADYMMDPEVNSVRALSQRHGISLKRVDAILRLKGLEAAYVKNKTLQTGFLWGMEMLLGVKASSQDANERVDVHTADMLEQEENRDAARQRFQRQYWESIPDDGNEPLLPASLEHAKKIAERSAQAAHDNKSNSVLMPRFKDTDTIKSPRQKVQVVVREGRLPMHFVDVGGKFLQADDRLKRMAAAKRRQVLRARSSEEKVLQGRLRGRTSLERARRAAVKRAAPRSPPPHSV
ncbi:eukaryotic mitochondrial regulator protein-domain-containing protein [Favolaschia claudopus]|uniref:Eukaryotic mitochondrial regulator protein-domain-containing protein n=1 Tax=Favolaschia claudopus TaxID=2862362 RepID=A0AAW0EG30_9AGAR